MKTNRVPTAYHYPPPAALRTVRGGERLLIGLLLSAAITLAIAARGDDAQSADSAKAVGKVDLTEKSLDELLGLKVYAASKRQQKISEAPSSVTVIDSDEIKKYGYRNFTDILRSVRSLYVSYDRNYSYLGVRGFSRPGDFNSRILVLIDGHRINDNVYDQTLLGYDFPLDIDLIDRVEVIRGPGSSIYGNNAFFGVINVITKTGQDFKTVEGAAAAGSFGTYEGRLTYGNKFKNGIGLLLSATYLTSDGPSRLYYPEFNTPSNNVHNGVAEHADYESFYKGFASLSYQDFTLEGDFSTREKGIPTGSYATIFNDTRAKTRDDRGYADLKYHHQFSPDLDVTARLFYDNSYYHGDYPVINAVGTDVLYKDFAYGSWWGTEVQANQRFFDRHTLTVGAEFRDNLRQDQRAYYDQVPRQIDVDDKRTSRNFALYGQGEVFLLTNLILNAGVRYDKFDTFGDTVNPRVGLIWNPIDDTTFKGLYGTAFKAPNIYEQFYASPTTKGNPNLRAEEITTYEFVYEQKISKHFQFEAGGFYYEINDLINQTIDPLDGLLVYRNIDKVTAYGIETELDAKFTNGVRGRLSYTYQQTTDEQTHAILSNSPRHLAKLNLIVPIYRDKLFSGLELQYKGPVKTLTGNTASGYLLVNGTIFSQKIVKNLELSFTVFNLFDKTYYNPGGGEHLQDQIRQDGRTWWLKLNYRF